MSNKGIRMYVMGEIHDGKYKGTSRCRKLYINWITVRGSVGVNRSLEESLPEVGGALLYDFLSSYMPNYY
jgi:hypothetical protein